MAHRAHRPARPAIRFRGAVLAMIGIGLAGAPALAQTVLPLDEITPTHTGVVLKGTFNANAKAVYPRPYPTQALVTIAADGQGATGKARAALKFSGDKFRAELATDKLPSIPANRKVSFTLTFPENQGIAFQGDKSFTGAIGPPPASVNKRDVPQTGSTSAVTESLKGDKGDKGDPGADGKTPTLPYLERVPVGAVIEADTVLLLLLAGLLIWLLTVRLRDRRRKGSRRPAVETRDTLQDSVLLNRVVGPFPDDPVAALRDELEGHVKTWEEAKSSIIHALGGLKTRIEAMSTLLAKYPPDAASLFERKIDEEAKEILRALDAVRGDEARSASQWGSRDASSPAAGGASAVASVVNEWLQRGGQDRGLLMRLASQAEVTDPRLADYKNAGRMSSGSAPEPTFSFSQDGSWLWAGIPGSAEFWAAPADTLFLTMGDAPAMLNKLFDGMQGAQSGFRFKAIYKPCRLRPIPGSPGQFALVQRGVLHLEGAPEPSLAKPMDFQSLARAAQPAAASPPIGDSVGSWIRRVASKLADQDRRIRELYEEVRTQPVKSAAPDYQAALRQVTAEINQLKAELKAIPARMASAVAAARKSAAVSAPPPPVSESPANPPPASGPTPETVTPVEAAPLQTASEPAPTLPPQPAIVPQSAPVPASTFAVLDLPDEADGLPWTLEELRRGRPTSLPSLWKEAFEAAAQQPEADPEERRVPSGETYLQRVRAYCDALNRADTPTEFDIVHFQKAAAPNQNLIELHRTSEDAAVPPGVLCGTCDRPPEWQFAVRAALRGGEIVYLLFPWCTIDKSKYASVYSALIEALPEVPFSTAAMEGPAVLSLNKLTGLFSIVKKIKLTEAGSAGRG